MPSASGNWAPEAPARTQGADGGGSTSRPGLVLGLDWQEPAAVFDLFKHDPHLAWFDSQGVGKRCLTSYLCVSPFEVHTHGSPFLVLDKFLELFRDFSIDAPVPFAGGAAGFLGYESAAWLENVPRHPNTDSPDMFVGCYDVVFAWDHPGRRLWLISTGLPETEPRARAARARARQETMLLRLLRHPPVPAAIPALPWRQDTPREVHEARVARAISYIRAGDIFQANIAGAFSAPIPPNLSAADIHLRLRTKNPAPYGAFVECGDGVAIASVSPERFLGVTREGDIEARPIKGTRPRSPHPGQDCAFAAALLASEKDRAENLMIVDLLRNDIGRVAKFGSVRVPELARLESFPHVHHLVSSVRGKLRPGATAVDLLRAAFPGGSITGAPKIRAIEIIHELEPAARGPYCGSVFWLGPDGAMDSSILIRTATITPAKITIQAGGGIVADSDPAAEYEEMVLKARPLLAALGTPPE